MSRHVPDSNASFPRPSSPYFGVVLQYSVLASQLDIRASVLWMSNDCCLFEPINGMGAQRTGPVPSMGGGYAQLQSVSLSSDVALLNDWPPAVPPYTHNY